MASKIAYLQPRKVPEHVHGVQYPRARLREDLKEQYDVQLAGFRVACAWHAFCESMSPCIPIAAAVLY